MQPTRRDFLRLGIGTAGVVACGAPAPTYLVRSAAALAANPTAAARDRVLVVVQLTGGNDGLNTVVPFRDPLYRRHRPALALPAAELHRLNDDLALHPSLGGFMRLYDSRRLAIVQGVGYPNPNRSHFESLACWHTARFDTGRDTPGWLARTLDRRKRPGGDAPAFFVGTGALPQALWGGRSQVPSLERAEEFRRRIGAPAGSGATRHRAALDEVGALAGGGPGSLQEFITRSTAVTYTSSARLEQVLRGRTARGSYPESPLGRRLRLVGQMIRAGLGASVYYTGLDGFDTHGEQLGTHARLLRAAGDSLRAFLDQLADSGDAGRTLVLVFSEFGRRVPAPGNGSDHGAAAPVFLLGPAVRPGVHGPNPDLQDLLDGDLRHAYDFRRVYATVLDRWLGCPAAQVLGARFEHLPLLNS